MASLFQELKRRKVFRVAAVYAVVAWVLIQVADTVLPALQTPEWAVSFVTVLFILGFPIAVILAWAFEVTPDGIKADGASQSQQTVAQPIDQKLIYAILGLLLLFGGFQIADRFLLDSASTPIPSPIASSGEQVRRTIIPLGPMPASQTVVGLRTDVALTSDGSRLAYSSYNNGRSQIHIRDLNQLKPRTLDAASGVFSNSSLIFSPDGEWLAYIAGNVLMKVSVAGGAPQIIAERVNLVADWNEDDTLIVSDFNWRLGLVSASTGEMERVNIAPISDLEAHVFARYLPGENTILFTRGENYTAAVGPIRNVEIFNISENESRLLIQNAINATYSPTGHIVFMRDGSLWAVPFDAVDLQVTGSEVMLVEGIEGVSRFGVATYALSSNGDLVYLPGVDAEVVSRQKSTLAWVDRNGAETILEMVPQDYRSPRLSPDGNRIALVIFQSKYLSYDIWSYELDRSTLSRITYSTNVQSPLWSPDGGRLVYDTPGGIRSVNATGLGQVETLLEVSEDTFGRRMLTAYIPDGTEVLYSEGSVRQSRFISSSVQKLSLAPEHTSSPLLTSEFIEEGATISPNGRWLAYVTNETGRNEVYVRPYPDVDSNRWTISSGGGGDPQWAADTGELFYRNRTENGTETWAVRVATEGEFTADNAELLFTSDHYYFQTMGNYSVSADGQRFIMLKPVAEGEADQLAVDTNLVLVENFAADLRRLVPPDPR